MSCSTRAKTLASTFSRSHTSLAAAAPDARASLTAAGSAPAQRLPRLRLAHVRLDLRQPRRVVPTHLSYLILSYLELLSAEIAPHPALSDEHNALRANRVAAESVPERSRA